MENCGVYKISFPSGNFYIGSSVNLRRRFVQHKRDLFLGIHINTALQNAYNKYGADLMKIEVIRYTIPETVRQWEQLYMDRFKPEYNISKQADCAIFDAAVSAKRIQMLSKPVRCLNTGEVYPSGYAAARAVGCEKSKDQIVTAIKKHYLFGDCYWAYASDPITLEEVLIGVEERETKRKISAANATSKVRSRQVIRLIDGKVFSSAMVASKQLGLGRTAVFSACKTSSKVAGSYWCYADDPKTYAEVESIHLQKLANRKEKQRSVTSKRLSRQIKNISTGMVYPSIQDAAATVGIRSDRFSSLVKSGVKVGGYKWEMMA